MNRVLELLAACCMLWSVTAWPADRPNILVIWGDDIGISNLSVYSMGLLGYQTPKIDRIAREGMVFTDYYGEQSCTAGCSTVITGQSGLRAGLLKIGVPGSELGISDKAPTIAELLKPYGYAAVQFGKNHLGDKGKVFYTNHEVVEYFGNLYHLAAKEEAERPDYPEDPGFRQVFGPRGVIHSYAAVLGDGDCHPVHGDIQRVPPGRRLPASRLWA